MKSVSHGLKEENIGSADKEILARSTNVSVHLDFGVEQEAGKKLVQTAKTG